MHVRRQAHHPLVFENSAILREPFASCHKSSPLTVAALSRGGPTGIIFGKSLATADAVRLAVPRKPEQFKSCRAAEDEMEEMSLQSVKSHDKLSAHSCVLGRVIACSASCRFRDR